MGKKAALTWNYLRGVLFVGLGIVALLGGAPFWSCVFMIIIGALFIGLGYFAGGAGTAGPGDSAPTARNLPDAYPASDAISAAPTIEYVDDAEALEQATLEVMGARIPESEGTDAADPGDPANPAATRSGYETWLASQTDADFEEFIGLLTSEDNLPRGSEAATLAATYPAAAGRPEFETLVASARS